MVVEKIRERRISLCSQRARRVIFIVRYYSSVGRARISFCYPFTRYSSIIHYPCYFMVRTMEKLAALTHTVCDAQNIFILLSARVYSAGITRYRLRNLYQCRKRGRKARCEYKPTPEFARSRRYTVTRLYLIKTRSHEPSVVLPTPKFL